MTWWSTLGQTLIFCAVVGPLCRVAARRLINLDASYPRVVVTLALVLIAIRPLLNVALGEPSSSSESVVIVLYLVTMLTASVLLTLLALVVLELLVPAASTPPLTGLPASLRDTWRRQRRYRNAVRVFVRHGLRHALTANQPTSGPAPLTRDPAAPVAFRRALEDLGVTFVKLGQQLSTRADLLPPEYLEQLALLQDSAPTFGFDQVQAQLSESLGPDWHRHFTAFSPEPFAGASIAQVHRATLTDGTEVVVKVRRPGIVEQVRADLDIMNRLALNLERRAAWARRMGVRSLAQGFGTALAEELDFRIEAANTGIAAANLDAERFTSIRIPRVYNDLCSTAILVSEFMNGTPLGRADSLLSNRTTEERDELAGQLFGCVIEQLLDHGVFHVDLHPGNIMVQPDGTLAMLDFGSVGRLATHSRTTMSLLLVAIGQGNSVAAADYLLEIVDGADAVDERRFEDELGQIMLRHLGGDSTDSAAAFTSLLTLAIDHGLRIPGPVAAAFRAIGTLEGTLRVISGSYDLIETARTQASAAFAGQLSPDAIKQTLGAEVLQALPTLRRIPRRIERISTQLEQGKLRASVRVFADPDDRNFVRSLVDTIALAVLTAISGGMAVAFFQIDRAPYVAEGLSLFSVLGGFFLATTVLLSLRVLVGVLNRNE